jgi:hypothetical protein
MRRTTMMLCLAIALGACSKSAPPAENATQTADGLPAGNALPPPEYEVVPPDESSNPTDAWIGKWIGVEGLVLDVEPGAEAGKYALTITLLDGTNKYVGTADGETIRFTRDGKTETIKAATGADTGLKYLAGKDDCLMIKSGEGFCRD